MRASMAAFPETLNPKLREVLAARGIEKLYTHQALACQKVVAGENVVDRDADGERENALL